MAAVTSDSKFDDEADAFCRFGLDFRADLFITFLFIKITT